MLSSVSASTPVLLSASELSVDELSDEDSVEDEASEVAGGEVSVVTAEAAGAEEDSLFSFFSRRAFLALRRASFLSSFWRMS